MISYSKMAARALIAGLALTLAAWGMPGSPGAFAADAKNPLQAFQKNKLPSQQQLKQSYANVTYRPFQRKDLTFNLLMPNGWRDIPLSVPAEMLQQDTQKMIEVAEHRAPENDKSGASIQVAYTRMDMEVSLHDLIDLYFKQNKVHVLMRRQGTYNQRKIDEALIRSKKDGVAFLSRITFSRHGDRVFVVSGSALESEFSRQAPSFAAAAISFTVNHKAPHPYAASMDVFTSTGVPRLKFNYPKDWEIEENQNPQAGQTGVDLRLVVRDAKKEKVTTYGFIRVRGFSKGAGQTAEQILVNIKKDFENIPLSYQQCTLRADLLPNQPRPLGRLEKWDVMVRGVPGQAGFLVLPHGSDSLALGLFCMRPADNLVSWLHVWRVFEIIADDLSGKHLAISKIKNNTLPSQREIKRLVAATMEDFATAAQKQDFNAFHANISTTWQVQTTPDKLRSAFRGFGKQKELDALRQLDPVVEKEICIDHDGLLKCTGHYPTRPQAATFTLTYIHEQATWKLVGIHVAMK